MTNIIFRVRIDDIDRAQCPDKPWAATLVDENDQVFTASSGIGATPEAALEDLVKEIEIEIDEAVDA